MDKVKLGDYITVKTGKLDANAADENGLYPFFTCSQTPLRINDYAFDCECVLIAGNGDLNVKYYNGKFNAYQRTYIITATKEINTKYLYRFFDFYIEKLRQQSIGGVIKYIKLNNLTDIKFNLYDLQTQQKIVDELDCLSDIIEKKKQQLADLDNLVKSKFIEMFGKINKKIEVVKVAKVLGGFSFESSDITTSGVRLLQISNVALNNVDWKAINYLPKDYLNKYKTFKLNENDIIMALTRPIIQSLGNVKTSIVRANDLPSLLNQRVAKIESFNVNHLFLFYCFMTDEFTQYVKDNCSGSSQPNMSTKSIEKYLIPNVQIKLQNEFASFVEQIDKSKLELQQSIEETQILFNERMQHYFGE